jgi:hypothetical protein
MQKIPSPRPGLDLIAVLRCVGEDSGQMVNYDLSVLIFANDGSISGWLAKLEELMFLA